MIKSGIETKGKPAPPAEDERTTASIVVIVVAGAPTLVGHFSTIRPWITAAAAATGKEVIH